jgi:hypothetical protein
MASSRVCVRASRWRTQGRSITRLPPLNPVSRAHCWTSARVRFAIVVWAARVTRSWLS